MTDTDVSRLGARSAARAFGRLLALGGRQLSEWNWPSASRGLADLLRNRIEAFPAPGPEDWARTLNADHKRTRFHPAIVLGGGYSGLAIVRSLGRRGVPVFVLDDRAREAGMHSRHGRPIVMPGPEAHAGRWIDFLTGMGRMLDCRPIVFAAGDPHLDLLSASRESLAESYSLSIAPGEAIELLRDKRLQYRLLLEHGVAMPATRVPESAAEAADDAGSVGLPCLVKPAVSHRWWQVRAAKAIGADTPGQAAEVYKEMTATGCGCLIQQLIPGGDDQLFGALSYLGQDGEPLATLTKRKLRQYPEQFGNGSVQISVDLPDLAASSSELLRKLGCRGFGSIEYKFDPADGKMKLLEINPRPVSGYQLAIDSGCDLPWIAYRDLAGLPREGTPVHRSGVLFVNEAWELRRVMKRGSLRDWAGYASTLARARSHAAWSLEDPGPAWSLIRRAMTGGFDA